MKYILINKDALERPLNASEPQSTKVLEFYIYFQVNT
jgi:hypothetical protein